MRWLIGAGIVLVGSVFTSPVFAQNGVLHEYVAPDLLRRLDPARASETRLKGDGPVPDALERDGIRLDAPQADGDEAAFGKSNANGIERPTETRPDRKTEVDEALRYHKVFNPTVAPLRRNIAFDVIEADYRVRLGPIRRRSVPLSPRKPRPGRELFWGEFSLKGRAGIAQPIPSVAPDMGILAASAKTADGKPVRITFEKDQADNFYAKTDRRGPIRLVFLVDADTAYFSAPLPDTVELGTQLGTEWTAIPERARAPATRILAHLGVSKHMPFARGLDRMVTWFREFEAGKPPPERGDIFEDLAMGQVGVCRHRAFAFTILARAAGVPTRYVQNEAHAFAEVRTPDGRWRRVDLGGEAPELTFEGRKGGRLHTPQPDPFSKPERYREQYSAVLGAPNADRGPTVKNGPKTMGGSGNIGAGWGADGAPLAVPNVEVPLPLRPDEASDIEAPPNDDAEPVKITLTVPETSEVFRGEALPFKIQGRLSAGVGQAVVAIKVQIYLISDENGAAIPVGPAAVANAEGRFTVDARLPPRLLPGGYTLVAASAADDGWAASRSDL